MSAQRLSRRQMLTAALGAAALKAASPQLRVGCQTNAWKLNPPDFNVLLEKVRDLKSLGYSAFECNVRYVESQFPVARRAQERIATTGVTFYGPHTDLHWPLEQLLRYADGAAAIGAKHLALSAGPGGNVKLDAESLRRKLETVSRLGDHCKSLGVRLVSHNYPVDYGDKAQGFEEMLRRTDAGSVYFLIDIGNAFQAGADVAELLTRHPARIDSFHLRDLRAGKQVPLGQGEFNFRQLGDTMQKLSWDGWLTLEEESLNSTDDGYIKSVLTASRAEIKGSFGV